ncbi:MULTISPECIES: HPr family phosphocarrier protein [Alicyclobacillus]|jgi:phosphotransferase system HPr (HPr) family protein|uniref:Phosphotransferase system, phosphocarrier protein HPr n=3 Tax=Alicyclobacillus TaxID=29330 RepID=C8WY51_ALIAD|nr:MULTISPECIES: HPr family phosphocarrier protein [Alicyclobacillus]ACV59147.1 Phosphotransferase system, phosphocarrier protein HPr [Alicyclobacillus acidocaldarius subsp. acidocaldarius DSM 446]AEJ44163.1 Phosphotransferase system, phosphocarrier protein HPr [Alicyclobacillus acidocaldarius subsp. acidocaldarius Tc-4-1]MDI9260576.1 HPr family phosphocarrier protein [Alicyclobacillus sendaiensis PA2]
MVEKVLTVNLPQGLAARPAAEFVKRASSFSSQIRIGKNGHFVDAKSVLGVMSMAIARGESVTLQAEGSDAERAVETLAELLSRDTFE